MRLKISKPLTQKNRTILGSHIENHLSPLTKNHLNKCLTIKMETYSVRINKAQVKVTVSINMKLSLNENF